MDYKKTTAPDNTITRDMISMAEETDNVYETVRIIGKRANEISVDLKQELGKKLQEFSSVNDSLEEIFENREQIEISRYFERLPKSTLIATQEFLDHEIYYRNPVKEKDKLEEL
ncbi:MAG: DNA-directed RNA polymerase subunit omega [Dysgonamonadaceae bacterium]|jgi:DNA-directed RNA polymerase subunit K/omega|nr:DNA-directed RNA polymerase subunit omega [Dysgonamonadaceae bacterium]